MRCLWITRDLPYPATAGDVIYTSHLVEAFARAGADVTVLCRAPDGPAAAVPESTIDWRSVRASLRGVPASLLSKLPSIAHRYDVAPLRDALATELSREWDVILIDHIGAGWALPQVERHRASAKPPPTLVYISHNHEASTRRAVAQNAKGDPVRRALLRFDASKSVPLERALVKAADLVTVNTVEDEALYRADAPRQRYLVVLPGYEERIVDARTMTDSIPRRAVIVGSFDWIAKRANLEEFVAVADPAFADAGAELVVIGRGPEPWLDEMRSRTRATTFTGFVDSVTPYLDDARLGIVSERSGGGFKHKVLFYVFNRVPVAVLAGSIAGVPLEPGASLIESPSVEQLTADVLDAMADPPRLQALQESAFAACEGLFDWDRRGADLLESLESIRVS